MTKTAQLAISRGLAETTVGTGVTVDTVLPGPTASKGVNEFVDRLATSEKKTKAEFEAEFFHSIRPSPCCNVSRVPTKWQRWWHLSAARCRQPRTGRP